MTHHICYIKSKFDHLCILRKNMHNCEFSWVPILEKKEQHKKNLSICNDIPFLCLRFIFFHLTISDKAITHFFHNFKRNNSAISKSRKNNLEVHKSSYIFNPLAVHWANIDLAHLKTSTTYVSNVSTTYFQ